MQLDRKLDRPAWNRVKATHNRGVRVEGVVWKEIGVGHLIRIGRSHRLVLGLLSKSEVRKERLAADPTTLDLRLGQTVTAYVKDYDNEHMRLVLSFRKERCEADEDFMESISVGDKLVGRVVDHASAGVFVRLESGFDALLPETQVPLVGGRAIDDLLQLGDQVAAVVYFKSSSRRQIHLSVTKLLEDWSPDSTEGRRVQVDEDAPAGSTGVPPFYTPIRKAKQPRCVAVLDDDEDNLVGLTSFLLKCDHRVHPSKELSQFYEDIKEHGVECVVVDVFVHGDNVLREIVDKIEAEHPSVRIIVCSAYSAAGTEATALKDRGLIIDCLLKPVDLARLAERLDTLQLADRFEVEVDVAVKQADAGQYVPQVRKSPGGKSRNKTLDELFASVRRQYPEDAVLIVRRPRGSRDPQFIRGDGISTNGFEYVRKQLKHSPIGSVINDGEVTQVAEFRSACGGRLAIVQELVACSSMMGAPVFVMGQPEYGLFVLRTGDEPFSQEDTQRLEMVAREGHLDLERLANMEQITRDHSRLAIANLYASLAHETGNAVNVINESLVLVQAQLAQLEKGELSAPEQKELAKPLERIARRGPQICRVLKSLLGNLSREPDVCVELYQLLHEVVDALEPLARMSKIELSCSVDSRLCRFQFPDLPIRQSVFNLVLNAVLQLRLEHAQMEAKGYAHTQRIEVRGEICETGDLPISISVADTGRGVHEDYRERVFDAYYTTRQDGSGLGLYLTRWFVEAQGGRVFIRRTARFDGTEFRMDLPLP
jgi:signal transduction histidine kinase/response regulator of citrate/malate metabolism/predicted RNA-binding protein with RPS1 domain